MSDDSSSRESSGWSCLATVAILLALVLIDRRVAVCSLGCVWPRRRTGVSTLQDGFLMTAPITRRWLRFSLRTLLLVFTAIAVPLAWTVNLYHWVHQRFGAMFAAGEYTASHGYIDITAVARFL